MPIYEYACECGAHFESLERIGEVRERCGERCANRAAAPASPHPAGMELHCPATLAQAPVADGLPSGWVVHGTPDDIPRTIARVATRAARPTTSALSDFNAPVGRGRDRPTQRSAEASDGGCHEHPHHEHEPADADNDHAGGPDDTKSGLEPRSGSTYQPNATASTRRTPTRARDPREASDRVFWERAAVSRTLRPTVALVGLSRAPRGGDRLAASIPLEEGAATRL